MLSSALPDVGSVGGGGMCAKYSSYIHTLQGITGYFCEYLIFLQLEMFTTKPQLVVRTSTSIVIQRNNNPRVAPFSKTKGFWVVPGRHMCLHPILRLPEIVGLARNSASTTAVVLELT